MNLRKKVTTVFGAAAAASVIAGAAAFACTNLATLNLSSTAGKAGRLRHRHRLVLPGELGQRRHF